MNPSNNLCLPFLNSATNSNRLILHYKLHFYTTLLTAKSLNMPRIYEIFIKIFKKFLFKKNRFWKLFFMNPNSNLCLPSLNSATNSNRLILHYKLHFYTTLLTAKSLTMPRIYEIFIKIFKKFLFRKKNRFWKFFYKNSSNNLCLPFFK